MVDPYLAMGDIAGLSAGSIKYLRSIILTEWSQS